MGPNVLSLFHQLRKTGLTEAFVRECIARHDSPVSFGQMVVGLFYFPHSETAAVELAFTLMEMGWSGEELVTSQAEAKLLNNLNAVQHAWDSLQVVDAMSTELQIIRENR